MFVERIAQARVDSHDVVNLKTCSIMSPGWCSGVILTTWEGICNLMLLFSAHTVRIRKRAYILQILLFAHGIDGLVGLLLCPSLDPTRCLRSLWTPYVSKETRVAVSCSGGSATRVTEET
jgi:hypothetical protein